MFATIPFFKLLKCLCECSFNGKYSLLLSKILLFLLYIEDKINNESNGLLSDNSNKPIVSSSVTTLSLRNSLQLPELNSNLSILN